MGVEMAGVGSETYPMLVNGALKTSEVKIAGWAAAVNGILPEFLSSAIPLS